MFAYCENNPVNKTDLLGCDSFYINLGGIACLFTGISGALQYVFDTQEKNETQLSYSGMPFDTELTTFGFINSGIGFNYAWIWDCDTIEDYNKSGDTAYFGGAFGSSSVDLLISDDKIVGIQIGRSIGFSLELHTGTSRNKTILGPSINKRPTYEKLDFQFKRKLMRPSSVKFYSAYLDDLKSNQQYMH